MAQANVQSINTQPDGKSGPTGDLFSRAGFTVIQDGKTTSGSSVDWFVCQVESVANIVKEGLMNQPSASKPRISPFHHADDSDHSYINGKWRWQSPTDPSANGMLILTELNGEIRGYSLVEMPLKANVSKAQSVAVRVPLRGTTRIDNKGRKIITFSTTGRNVARAESTMTLSSDGNQLSGTTQSSIATRPGSNAKSPVEYRVEAKRIG